MKKLLEIFKGDNGQLSSKRFVGIIGAFVLFGTMAHNSMSPQEIAPSKELVAAVEWVTISVVSPSLPHLKRGARRDILQILEDAGLYSDEAFNKTDNVYHYEVELVPNQPEVDDLIKSEEENNG